MRIGQGAALQRLHSTLDSTRLLLIRVSRSLASSRLLPVLGLFTSLLALAFAFLWRFSHLLTAVVLFRYIWKSLYAFYQAKLGGAWGPAFPPHRTNFILAVGTIPIWGLGMAGIMLASAIVRRLWSGARLRWEGGKRGGHVNGNGHGRYEAIPLNVDDVEEMEEEDTRRRRQRRESPTPALKTRLLWLGLLVFYLSLALFGLYMWKTYELPIDNRFKARVELANRVPKREGYSTQEKIYIAAMFYNNEGVLPYWITQTTRLIHYLGPDNVFVSIVESNSGDKTAALLESFADTLTSLAVSHKITTHDTTIPRPPSMDTAPPRIEFLSAVRNLVMAPLIASGGYTRVLWSNDVFIEAETMAELIHTRNGDYDMVCGLDLAYWGLYDQWVIRDRQGGFASTLWPYLLEETGFRAIQKDEAAPVSACWNGIAAMRADPFLPPSMRKGVPAFLSPIETGQTQPWSMSTETLPQLASTHPAYPRPENATALDMPAVKFRASGPKECFSSESFLLPYDLRRIFGMHSIFVNPLVINSYSWEFYVYFKYITRHWVVKWFIEHVENGYGFHQARMILGNPENVYMWDGGACHPWR